MSAGQRPDSWHLRSRREHSDENIGLKPMFIHTPPYFHWKKNVSRRQDREKEETISIREKPVDYGREKLKNILYYKIDFF